MKLENIKLSQKSRFEFIEFQIQWEGSIGRMALQNKFGISPQQATLDLTGYQDLAPNNLYYDPRKRAYLRDKNFRPVFIGTSSEGYLSQLELEDIGVQGSEITMLSDPPPFHVIRPDMRAVESTVLQNILESLKHSLIIEVDYMSFSSGSSGNRRLLPKTLLSDIHRWHIRAFDVDKNRYSDFVLSRMHSVSITNEKLENPPKDEAWDTFTEIRLIPQQKLRPYERNQLEQEYDMTDGVLCKKVRKAMLWYYLRAYGFDPYGSVEGGMVNKSSFQLELQNFEDVEMDLARR